MADEYRHESRPVLSGKMTSLIQEIHLSHTSSTSVPRTRKTASPLKHILNAPPPIPVDREVSEKISLAYSGKKKPALVITFSQNSSGAYICSLGDVQIRVSKWHRNGAYTAILIQKKLVFRKQRYVRGRGILPAEFKLVPTEIMRYIGLPGESAYKVARGLMAKPGWFYHEYEWRSLAWVYKSLVLIGIGYDPTLPAEYVSGLKSGDNLHVPGYWLWQAQYVPKFKIRPVSLPRNYGLTRTPVMPDTRSELGYDQNSVDDPPKRKRVLDTWVVKAPEPMPWSNKNMNPNRKPGDSPPSPVSIREWESL